MRIPELRFDDILAILRLLDRRASEITVQFHKIERRVAFRKIIRGPGFDDFMFARTVEIKCLTTEMQHLREMASALLVSSGSDDDGAVLTFEEMLAKLSPPGT